MSVSESGMGQCECESNHATHAFFEASGVRRCQRRATSIIPGLYPHHSEHVDIPGSYVCEECAKFHEEARK